jgi:hypothetical protein
MFSKKMYNKEDSGKYAAYLIYVRNIEDFKEAKNEITKHSNCVLPSNDDIRKELDSLASLNGYNDYNSHVQFVREASFNFMLSLFNYSPHLTGGTARGIIGLNSKIQISIFNPNNQKNISDLLEKENDIFLKNESEKLHAKYDNIIVFEDFKSELSFEIFVYNEKTKFNNFLEYNYCWNIYNLAKNINKLDILKNFEQNLKKE